jgi:prevent-host-death family protein
VAWASAFGFIGIIIDHNFRNCKTRKTESVGLRQRVQTSQPCRSVLDYPEVSTISITDLSERFATQWLKSVDKSDLIVTSQGKPVAVLLPISGESLENLLSALRSVRATLALTELQQSAEANGTSDLSDAEIEAEIDAARCDRHRK